MQLITAIVAPSRVDAVLRGLRIFGVRGWTLSHAYAIGPPTVHVVRLDLVAANVDTPDLARIIARAALPTGLWITPVDLMVRIATGERGPNAVL